MCGFVGTKLNIYNQKRRVLDKMTQILYNISINL